MATSQQILEIFKGMLGSVSDNFHDVRADLVFSDEEVREEARVLETLTYIVENWVDFEPYAMWGDDE